MGFTGAMFPNENEASFVYRVLLHEAESFSLRINRDLLRRISPVVLQCTGLIAHRDACIFQESPAAILKRAVTASNPSPVGAYNCFPSRSVTMWTNFYLFTRADIH